MHGVLFGSYTTWCPECSSCFGQNAQHAAVGKGVPRIENVSDPTCSAAATAFSTAAVMTARCSASSSSFSASALPTT